MASEAGAVPVPPRAEPLDADAAALFRAHYPALCRLAYVIVGDRDRAEEIVMEAFLRTLVSWRRLRDPECAPAYLQRAVVNLARTSARRRLTERVATIRLHARPVVEVAAADRRVDADPVLAAVRALPAGQRAVVALRYYADLPEAEIAAVLGCSVGTVKSQLAKAKATLARRLATEGSA